MVRFGCGCSPAPERQGYKTIEEPPSVDEWQQAVDELKQASERSWVVPETTTAAFQPVLCGKTHRTVVSIGKGPYIDIT